MTGRIAYESTQPEGLERRKFSPISAMACYGPVLDRVIVCWKRDRSQGMERMPRRTKIRRWWRGLSKARGGSYSPARVGW
jgi:hypothetical protein